MEMDDIRSWIAAHRVNVAWGFFLLCLGYSLYNLFVINNIYNNELKIKAEEFKNNEFDYDLRVGWDAYYGTEIIEDKQHEITFRMVTMMFCLFIGGMIYARNLTGT